MLSIRCFLSKHFFAFVYMHFMPKIIGTILQGRGLKARTSDARLFKGPEVDLTLPSSQRRTNDSSP